MITFRKTKNLAVFWVIQGLGYERYELMDVLVIWTFWPYCVTRDKNWFKEFLPFRTVYQTWQIFVRSEMWTELTTSNPSLKSLLASFPSFLSPYAPKLLPSDRSLHCCSRWAAVTWGPGGPSLSPLYPSAAPSVALTRCSFPVWSRATGSHRSQSTSASGGHFGSLTVRDHYTVQPHRESSYDNGIVLPMRAQHCRGTNT